MSTRLINKALDFTGFVVLVLMIGTLFSCKEDEPVPEEYFSQKLDGFYDLVSMEAEIAVDLDMDGVFSRDILTETHQEENKSIYFLELNTEIYDWEPKFYYQRMFLWAPYATVISDEERRYLYTDYSYVNLLAKYRYYEETNAVVILGNLHGGNVLSASILGDSLMTVRFDQVYYTRNDEYYHEDGWEALVINATYLRRK